MNDLTIIVSIIGIIGTLSSIFFAYLAFKKNERQEAKKQGEHEGSILSDINYIKTCVDRVEKKLSRVDESYKDIIERLAKVEETVANVIKQVDSMGERS